MGGFFVKEHNAILDISSILKMDGDREDISRKISLEEFDSRFQNVFIDGQVRNIAGVLTVKLQIKGDFYTECDRCLDEVVLPLIATIDTVVSYHESKDDSITVQSGLIDLNKTAFDALSLMVPMSVLCNPGCKGLCASCGVNLNREHCICSELS